MHAFGAHRISNIKFVFMTAASVGRANYFSLHGILSLCGYMAMRYRCTSRAHHIENEEKKQKRYSLYSEPGVCACVIPECHSLFYCFENYASGEWGQQRFMVKQFVEMSHERSLTNSNNAPEPSRSGSGSIAAMARQTAQTDSIQSNAINLKVFRKYSTICHHGLCCSVVGSCLSNGFHGMQTKRGKRHLQHSPHLIAILCVLHGHRCRTFRRTSFANDVSANDDGSNEIATVAIDWMWKRDWMKWIGFGLNGVSRFIHAAAALAGRPMT